MLLFTFVFIAIIVASIFLLFRNTKVFKFRHFICHKAFAFDWKTHEEFNEKLKYADYICEKISYEKMLFSFKPLTFEKWFTEEEIYFIENHEFKN